MKRILPVVLLVIAAAYYFLFRPEEYLYRPDVDDDFQEDRYEDDGGAPAISGAPSSGAPRRGPSETEAP